MKTSLKNVIALLEARAEQEWQKLQELEHLYTPDETPERLAGRDARDAQRARWAAWDAAAEIAKGKSITSFETEQRSV